MESESHVDYKNTVYCQIGENREIWQKCAIFENFGPPIWIVNEFRFSPNIVQQRAVPKLRNSESLIKLN